MQKICLYLTILGAINWGLIGMFNLNLVEFLFGQGTLFARIIYVIIGLCGIMNILLLFRDIKTDEWVEE